MINRCIGCYYHDSKENVCTHGSPIFLDDTCTDYQDNEFVKQIRAEVINDFCKEYKNFQSDEGICNLQEDCSFSGGWCIDCFKDKWLKEQNK